MSKTTREYFVLELEANVGQSRPYQLGRYYEEGLILKCYDTAMYKSTLDVATTFKTLLQQSAESPTAPDASPDGPLNLGQKAKS